MKCPKGFICNESGFKTLCKASYLGQDKYVECLDDKPRQCSFSLTFGHTFLCNCPLRVRMAKEQTS